MNVCTPNLGPSCRLWIPPGPEGTRRTLEIMRELSRTASLQSLRVRDLAARLQTPQNLDNFLRQVWRVVPDPPDAEWIATPDRQLATYDARGFLGGDCDDAATLAAAVVRAQNCTCWFVAVRMTTDFEFSHVFLRACVGMNGWMPNTIDIDPIVPVEFMPIRGAVETMEIRV